MIHQIDKVLEDQNSESPAMQSGQRLWQAAAVTRQAPEPGSPAKNVFAHPASRQEDKAFRGFWQSDQFQLHLLNLGSLCGLISRAALIDNSHFGRLLPDFLYLTNQFFRLGAVLFIDWRHIPSQQMPQGVHGNVRFAALFAAMPIVTCSLAALWRRLQGRNVEDRGCGLPFAPLGQAQQGPQIMYDRLKYPSPDSTLGLLINREPGLQIIGHHPPRCTCSDNPAQAIEDFAQAVVSLGRFFAHQSHVRRHKSPFVTRNITWICFPFHVWSSPL
jgi:hypothetical protein